MKDLIDKLTSIAESGGEYWKGTDEAPPGKKLVGDSIIPELANDSKDKSLEWKLEEEFANFNEADEAITPEDVKSAWLQVFPHSSVSANIIMGDAGFAFRLSKDRTECANNIAENDPLYYRAFLRDGNFEESGCRLFINPEPGSYNVYGSAKMRKQTIKNVTVDKLVRRFNQVKDFISANAGNTKNVQFDIYSKLGTQPVNELNDNDNIDSEEKDLRSQIEQLKKMIANPRGRGVASMRQHLDQLYKELEDLINITEETIGTHPKRSVRKGARVRKTDETVLSEERESFLADVEMIKAELADVLRGNTKPEVFWKHLAAWRLTVGQVYSTDVFRHARDLLKSGEGERELAEAERDPDEDKPFRKHQQDKLDDEVAAGTNKDITKVKVSGSWKDRKKEALPLYYTTYSAALSSARAELERKGYTVSDDVWFREVNSGPRKPQPGRTNRLQLQLDKDGVPTKHHANIQVYNRGNEIPNAYELNMYTDNLKEGWESGPDERERPERDDDKKYRDRQQEKLDDPNTPKDDVTKVKISGAWKDRFKDKPTESKLGEAKSLHTHVKIVKGASAGKSGYVRQIKKNRLNGEVHLDIDLEDGGQTVELKQNCRVIKGTAEQLTELTPKKSAPGSTADTKFNGWNIRYQLAPKQGSTEFRGMAVHSQSAKTPPLSATGTSSQDVIDKLKAMIKTNKGNTEISADRVIVDFNVHVTRDIVGHNDEIFGDIIDLNGSPALLISATQQGGMQRAQDRRSSANKTEGTSGQHAFSMSGKKARAAGLTHARYTLGDATSYTAGVTAYPLEFNSEVHPGERVMLTNPGVTIAYPRKELGETGMSVNELNEDDDTNDYSSNWFVYNKKSQTPFKGFNSKDEAYTYLIDKMMFNNDYTVLHKSEIEHGYPPKTPIMADEAIDPPSSQGAPQAAPAVGTGGTIKPIVPGAGANPADDASLAQAALAGAATMKSAVGAPATPDALEKSLDAVSQGVSTNANDMKNVQPVLDVLNKASKDPKLANQFKQFASQAKLVP